MAALDACEPQVVRAFEKEKWSILDKPFVLRTNGRTVLADFSLQRRLNGTAEQVIVLEVKCFTNPQNDLPDFYMAIGQYEFYRSAIDFNHLSFPLYLAIPLAAFERLYEDPVVRNILRAAKISVVVIDIQQEEIVQWIN